MDGVWHLNAPQWTDFESSPQIPDEDYFDRLHENLEPKALFATEEPVKNVSEAVESEFEAKPKVVEAYREMTNDDSLVSETEIAKMTPVKVVSPKSRGKDCSKPKEITYDNVLTEAMASLQLSIKKKLRRSQAVKNTPSKVSATPTNADKMMASKMLGLLKGPRSTPSNPIPMWIRKTKPSEETVEEYVKKNLTNEVVGEEKTENEVAEKPDEPEPQNLQLDVVQIVEDAQNALAAKLPQRKRGSNVSQRSVCSSNGATHARFSTCGLRRRSLTAYRRRSNKYISLAEAIRKFETGTPKRFRTMSAKNSKPGPVQKVKANSVSVTVPISPALRCKSRARPSTLLSKDERDRVEIEEAKKHSVMARANSMKNIPQNAGKTVAKKPSEASFNQTEKIPRNNRESRMKVIVPSVVATEEGLTVQNAEISNFGVPDITIAKATATKTKPFSFELRNKELQEKKEKKIKELLSEEEKKTKVSFHARPVPTFKKPMIAAGGSKEPGAKSMTKTCPFSFEARDKNVVKKKEEKMKTVLEESKKARMFQAKPLPEFKPVLVRGVSKENLNKPQKSRISMLPVSRSNSRSCLLTRSVSNQENFNPSTKSQLPKPKLSEDKNETQKVLGEFHLNTDKRARDRREYDERIKQKVQEIETLKREKEAEKMMLEEKERAEIRRMAETKARPMPAYKTPTIVHSDKPLTNPQSPGWAMKTKR